MGSAGTTYATLRWKHYERVVDLTDCHVASRWTRARAWSQSQSPPSPVLTGHPGPYAESYCFHCHTISSATDLFSPALMRHNYLQASNELRPLLSSRTYTRLAVSRSVPVAGRRAGRRDSAEASERCRKRWGELSGKTERELLQGLAEPSLCVDQHFLRDL